MVKKKIDFEDILADYADEDQAVETPLSRNFFKTIFLIFAVALVAVFFQLINLGLFQNDLYARRALANSQKTIIQPAPRGIIKDRFEKPLIGNRATVSVYLNSNDLPKGLEERQEILDKIAAAFDLSYGELAIKIKDHDWQKNPRLLLNNDIDNNFFIRLSSLNLAGLEFQESFVRYYPSPLIFSHLLGYVGLVDIQDLEENPDLTQADLKGRDGLEAFYNDYLQGINGRKVSLRDFRGNIIDKSGYLEKALPGDNIETFIDAEFQEYFYNRLTKGLHDLGRNSGVGLAMDPRNGEVLALINIPSFDGEKIGDYLNKPLSPLFNRSVSGLYSPGSIIKPLVAVAALKEGVISPQKRIYAGPYIEIPNPYQTSAPYRYPDWKPHGWVSLKEALARSSNIYFYEVGGGFEDQAGLGIAKLKKWWEKFNFDKKTGIDLPGEKTGVLPDPAWRKEISGEDWRLGDTYHVSIGQGDLSMSPISLLNYFSALANGGHFYSPRVVRSIKNSDGEMVFYGELKSIGDISEEIVSVLPAIRQGIAEAASQPYGTAYALHDLPFKIAAKTGTAQIQDNRKINAFFMGYAPLADPQIAILVLVEDAKEGSINTLPIAKDVLLWYYQNRLIKSNL
ncbi:MAG: penicillin-binding transpeptidase domain-containing protein [bacterium]|nr:penicillin-binding transpeptidase domain-containing protein [bacterium]